MISVIIPVYNAENYLSRCIESVLASSCRHFEILLINDGSTDKSLEICLDYSQRDPRIKVFSQENQGVSAARNKGISEARGEWLVFVDSDDFITGDFLSLAEREPCSRQDLILCNFSQRYLETSLKESGTDGASSAAASLHNAIYFSGGREMLRLVRRILVPSPLEGNNAPDFRSPCARIYKRDIIQQYSIRFSPCIRIGEDLLFNLEYQLRARSCVYIPDTVYIYDIHEGSSSHRFHPALRENHAALLRAVRDTLKVNTFFDPLEKEYYSYALENLTYVLIREVFHPNSPRTYRENICLCRKMRQNPDYAAAMKHNRNCGILPRRILVLCFRLRCFPLVCLLSRASYRYLNRTQKRLLSRTSSR